MDASLIELKAVLKRKKSFETFKREYFGANCDVPYGIES